MLNLRVLLVDDDRVTRLAIQLFLKEQVAHFHAVETAESALNVMKTNPAWHVVISDYSLPGMDGGAFLKKVKEMQPKLKTILITGYELADIDFVLKEGNIDHFIVKPISMDTIQYALASMNPD